MEETLEIGILKQLGVAATPHNLSRAEKAIKSYPKIDPIMAVMLYSGIILKPSKWIENAENKITEEAELFHKKRGKEVMEYMFADGSSMGMNISYDPVVAEQVYRRNMIDALNGTSQVTIDHLKIASTLPHTTLDELIATAEKIKEYLA